jgi:hypothetical protein
MDDSMALVAAFRFLRPWRGRPRRVVDRLADRLADGLDGASERQIGRGDASGGVRGHHDVDRVVVTAEVGMVP